MVLLPNAAKVPKNAFRGSRRDPVGAKPGIPLRYSVSLYRLFVCSRLQDYSTFTDFAKFCFGYPPYSKVCTDFVSLPMMRGVSSLADGERDLC